MSVRLKKNLGKLQAWASGQTKQLPPSQLPETPPAGTGKKQPLDELYQAACAGKEKYPSKQAAGMAQVSREQSGVRGEGMTAYCCRFCGSWHLGHS